MSTINNYDGNSMNNLFAGMGAGNGNAGLNGLYGINVIDYNTIKSGSYSKLMKAYYAEEEGDTKKASNSKNDTDDTDQTLSEIKNTTANLKESAQALYGSKSLFMKNEDGEYDVEAIYEKVNAFVEDYNEAVKSVGSAETENIAKAGASLVNAATNNLEMLSKIGIKINSSDFTMSVDKDKFMEANVADMKSLFSGVGSFAYQIGAKASRINTLVADKVSAGGSFVSGKKDTESSSSTSKDTTNTIAKVKDTANNLNSIGVDMYKNRDLFDADSKNYDEDKAVDAVSSFVEAYNDLLIQSENSKSDSIKNKVAAMVDVTETYKSRLELAGITIDKDDKTLSFDEETFRAANKLGVKNLFSGTASFAYKISVKAAMTASQAEMEANKSNTYTEDKKFSDNHNTGNIFDGMI